MSNPLAELQEATIKQHCKALRMPMMGMQFSSLAEQAVREKKTHMSVAAKKGTSLAVETEPGMGLRSGPRWAQ